MRLIYDEAGFKDVWTPQLAILNTSRFKLGRDCETKAHDTYVLNLARTREIERPLEYAYARHVGIVTHDCVHKVGQGEAVDGVLDQALGDLIQGLPAEKSPELEAKELAASLWLTATLPVIAQRSQASTAFSKADEVIASEQMYGLYFEADEIGREGPMLWVGIIDQIVQANDAVWAREVKTVHPTKPLAEYARAMLRGPQLTWEQLVAQEIAHINDVPFAGAIVDTYAKRVVPKDPSDMKPPKTMTCGKCDGTLEGAIAGHPVMADHAAHVAKLAEVAENYANRVRRATEERTHWASRVFHREPKTMDPQELLVKGIDYASQLYDMVYTLYHMPLGHTMNDDACVRFGVCTMEGFCPLNEAQKANIVTGEWMPQGFEKRAPDYVDALVGGVWPEDPREEFAWDEGEE